MGTLRSNEEQLVDLIVFSMSQTLRKDYRKAITPTRIAKIVFDVAKDLDLPITRSWYKFGTYVWWSDNASEERLQRFLGMLPPTPDMDKTINLANKEGKALYDQILDVVSKHRLMLRENMSEFLTRLYKKDAPKGFGPLYLANYSIMDRCDKVLDSIWKGEPVPQFMILSKEITGLHRALFHFQDRQDMIDLVIDGTSLLEDLLITYETNQDDLEKLKRFAKVFEVAFKFYKDDIWTFPASAMAVNTAEGERAELVKENRNEYLTKVSSFWEKVSNLSEQTLLQGFYPSKENIHVIQERMSRQLASDEKALRRVFAEQILVRR